MRVLCEVCEEAEAMPTADPYDDLDLCALCRADLNEQREERFLCEWLGLPATRSEMVH